MNESGENFSIVCEACGGYHSTDQHFIYETHERDKRVVEIKNRPDSFYRFNTLGFKLETEKEPWMQMVIDKAKELGDDLQDSDFSIHVGKFDEHRASYLDKYKAEGAFKNAPEVYPGILNILSQKTLQEGINLGWNNSISSGSGTLYASPHKSGAMFTHWSDNIAPDQDKTQDPRFLLNAQEFYVQNPTKENLLQYQEIIRKKLEDLKSGAEYLLKHEDKYFVDKGRANIDICIDLLGKLETLEGRKQAVEFILRQGGWGKGCREVGIILKIGEGIKSNPNLKTEKTGSQDRGRLVVKDEKGNLIANLPNVSSYQYKEAVSSATRGGRTVDDGINFPIKTEASEGVQDEFLGNYLHGIVVLDGSIELQQEVLQKILEITKDKPERRLPLYNHYGKLIWPRPPIVMQGYNLSKDKN